MRTVISVAILLLVLLCIASAARAEGARSSFVLIVTNNQSARLSRPPLRYADDDGAKYYELFRMVAPESNVTLLTTFDRDTAKLFPDLVGKARPPSKAQVLATAKAFADKVRAAKASGPVDFYFVFAGHGDVDGGKGFLELSDGSFTSDDLESLLKSIPATRSHVILDSCNSFFVINSRKPGGRHFVTSEEATRSLSERLPNVGVFLSTSAEAEVFEWSELQSGVFSHAVRSGLSGAADADGDGRVSYDELRAFVEIATRDVKNPNYRPQVFARGPGGRGGDGLLDLAKAEARRVRVDGPRRRLTVRDESDVPWIDLHKEAASQLTLRIPARLADSATLEELDATGAVQGRYRLRPEDPPDESLAALAPVEARASARGPDEMFRTLFAQPFGPVAFGQFRRDNKAEPLVLGVSSDERERMRLLLREAADSNERTRILQGTVGLVLGLGLGAGGGYFLERGIRKHYGFDDAIGGLYLAGGAYVATTNVLSLARPSLEERMYQSFSRGLALAPDTLQAQRLYADVERGLLYAADADRATRHRNLVFGALLLTAYGVVLTVELQQHGDLSHVQPGDAVIFGAAVLISGTMLVDSFFPTTTERMAELWKNDPSRVRARSTAAWLHLTPVIGPLGAGVLGTF